MNDIASENVVPIPNPLPPGEPTRESRGHVGWSVTETTSRLGSRQGTLSQLLNGRADMSANMVLALKNIG